MSLCFISNKHLTVTYSDIAKRLRDAGETVVWLSPSTRWTRWLVREGWNREAILNMPDFQSRWSAMSEAEARRLVEPFEVGSTLTAAHAVRMCRGLARREPGYALAYLATAMIEVEQFIAKHNIEVIFGEATWGFEIAAWMSANHSGATMVSPVYTRIPQNRFFMVEAVTADWVKFAPTTEGHRAEAEAFLTEWLNRPRRPNYMTGVHGYKAFSKHWIEEIKVGLDPSNDGGDETLWSLPERIFDRMRRPLRARWFHANVKDTRPAQAERYVLLCLQQQPESAIDVWGGVHFDQKALVQRVARMLPATHRLYIREHLSGLGDRPPSFYRDIQKLPGVRMVDPRVDIYPLIRGADLVVATTGTVTYEAALMGVPSACIGQLFFTPLLSVERGLRKDPVSWPWEQLLAADARARVTPSWERKVEFLADMFANSFEGDPERLMTPDAVRAAPGYVAAEAQGFHTFAKELRTKRATAAKPLRSTLAVLEAQA